MSDHNENIQLDHNYDGIQEYDNPLPGWWTWIFVGSFVFSIFYYFYYHMGTGDSVYDQYQDEAAHYIEMKFATLGDVGPDDPSMVYIMGREDIMAAMAGSYQANCGPCHANDGGGNVGPNLTDEFYKNVARPSDFIDIIRDGIAGTSMPAWGNRLRDEQIILLAAYVGHLRGTTPASGKEAEGGVADPWPTLEELGVSIDRFETPEG